MAETCVVEQTYIKQSVKKTLSCTLQTAIFNIDFYFVEVQKLMLGLDHCHKHVDVYRIP